jgi:hypothetical protein
MIEAQRFNQRDVLRRIPSLEMFLGVAPRIVYLRKPFAEIDAVPQMFRARSRKVSLIHLCLCSIRRRLRKRTRDASEAETKKKSG